MMQGLLRWLGASPMRAGAVAAALALSPLLNILAGGLLAMQSLQRGAMGGMQVAAVALPLILAAGILSGFGPLVAAQVAIQWAPILLMCLVLRRTQSQALAMQAGALFVVMAATVVYLLLPDPAAVLGEFVDKTLMPAVQQMDSLRQASDAELRKTFMATLPAMASVFTLLAMTLAMLIGRSWQASAWNPGGFGREFRGLRQGRSFALATAVLLLAAAISGHMLVGAIAATLVLLLLFQGLAIAHGLVRNRRLGAGWLWGLYGFLFLLPAPTSILLTATGGIDNWMDFRRRFPPENAGN